MCLFRENYLDTNLLFNSIQCKSDVIIQSILKGHVTLFFHVCIKVSYTIVDDIYHWQRLFNNINAGRIDSEDKSKDRYSEFECLTYIYTSIKDKHLFMLVFWTWAYHTSFLLKAYYLCNDISFIPISPWKKNPIIQDKDKTYM